MEMKQNGSVQKEKRTIDKGTKYSTGKPLQALDGGWGWVVVFSSLMVNILVDGIGLAYGVLLPKFAEHFQAPKSKVSLVGSLMIGTYMCSGPFVSGLVNKFGCRLATIIGSVIATIGVIIGSFSPTLNVLILTYGVIGGLGFGMMYLPSIVSVGQYFDKKRPIATGIAVCGSGIGAFIFSPVLEYLSEIYDWKNVLIVIAGIILNGAVCGMLIRPLELQTTHTKDKVKFDANRNSEIQNDTGVTEYYPVVDSSRSPDKLSKDKDYLFQNTKDEEVEPFIQLREQGSGYERIKRQAKSLNDITVLQDGTKTSYNINNRLSGSGCLVNTTMYTSLPDLKQSRAVLGSKTDNQTMQCRCLPSFLMNIFDFSLLLNVPFMLICLGNIFAAGAYYIPFMYLVDRALLLGIPSTEAAFLLSVIGMMNIIGRILAGTIANLKKVNALVVNNIALIIASVALFLEPLCTTYPLLVVFCVVFGLCVAAYVSLTSVILCDLLGVESLSNAFGFLGIARGIASVTGPLFAGMVFQYTGNYDASFYLGGGLFLLGGLLHLALHLPYIKRCSERGVKMEDALSNTITDL